MKAIFLILLMGQQPSEGGVAFFKLVNNSDNTIEVELTDTTGKKFSQITKISPKKHQLVAAIEGHYKCGVKGEKYVTCTIFAGQIVEISLPWKAQAQDVRPPPEPKKEKSPEIKKEETPPKKETPKEEEDKEPAIGPTAALVEITGIPSDGSLWFDDKKANRIRRWYKTPDQLNPGQTYYYIIKATVERGGVTYVDTHQVIVIAGRKTQVKFNLPK